MHILYKLGTFYNSEKMKVSILSIIIIATTTIQEKTFRLCF